MVSQTAICTSVTKFSLLTLVYRCANYKESSEVYIIQKFINCVQNCYLFFCLYLASLQHLVKWSLLAGRSVPKSAHSTSSTTPSAKMYFTQRHKHSKVRSISKSVVQELSGISKYSRSWYDRREKLSLNLSTVKKEERERSILGRSVKLYSRHKRTILSFRMCVAKFSILAWPYLLFFY